MKKMSLALVIWALFSLALGLIPIGIYCKDLRPAALAAIVYTASMLAGGLVGFIFGVPRVDSTDSMSRADKTLVYEGNAGDMLQAGLTARILANTNLEQISDWLTKIIVGVGLIQFRSIIEWFGGLAERVGADLAIEPASAVAMPADSAPVVEQASTGATVFAAALMIAGLTAGFITGWLFCRLLLATGMRIVDYLHQAYLSRREPSGGGA